MDYVAIVMEKDYVLTMYVFAYMDFDCRDQARYPWNLFSLEFCQFTYGCTVNPAMLE